MANIRGGVDIDRLTAQFDEFCQEILPSRCIQRIHQVEREHLAHINSKYGRFLAQFEASFDLLIQLTDHVNYGADRAQWPGHRAVQFILTVMDLKPIYSAFDKLVKGYYEDSFTLARVAYEAFLRTVFLSLYPDSPAYSFDKKKGTRGFNLTNFVEQDLRLDWNHYSILSAMAHSYKFPVLKKVVEFGKQGKREPLSLSFEYDELLIEVGINILKFLILTYLRTTTTLLLLPQKKIALDEVLLKKALYYIHLEQQQLLSHPTEDWRLLPADLDYVFELALSAEEGKDWKAIRDALRPR